MSAAAPPKVETCRVCLATAAQLAHQLVSLQKLDPALAKATVMAEPDLCVSCCLDLGRQAWAMAKISLSPHPEAAQYAAEYQARLEQRGRV